MLSRCARRLLLSLALLAPGVLCLRSQTSAALPAQGWHALCFQRRAVTPAPQTARMMDLRSAPDWQFGSGGGVSRAGNHPSVASSRNIGSAVTGNYPHSATGNYPNRGIGNYPAHSATGNYPTNAATGNYPHSTTGNYPHSTTGNYPHSATGNYPTNAANGNYPNRGTGNYPAHSATGNYPNHNAATGNYPNTGSNYPSNTATGNYPKPAMGNLLGVSNNHQSPHTGNFPHTVNSPISTGNRPPMTEDFRPTNSGDFVFPVEEQGTSGAHQGNTNGHHGFGNNGEYGANGVNFGGSATKKKPFRYFNHVPIEGPDPPCVGCVYQLSSEGFVQAPDTCQKQQNNVWRRG